MNKKMTVIISAAVMVGLFAVAALIYKKNQDEIANAKARAHAEALVRPYAPVFGNPDAKVTIVEFFDPACETCALFYPLVKEIMSMHGDKTRLVLRYAPFHPGSDKLVLMLEAARKQDKYQLALETMLGTQQTWASHHDPQPELVWQLLAQAGIDIARLQQDMASPELVQRLEQDVTDLKALKVEKTPSYFVNGEPLTEFGAQQLHDLIAKHVNNIP